MTGQEFFDFMMEPYGYPMTIGVFIIVYSGIGHFEELLGIRGVVKFIVALVIAVLFYNYGDDVVQKFTDFMHYLGLGAYEEGSYGTGK